VARAGALPLPSAGTAARPALRRRLEVVFWYGVLTAIAVGGHHSHWSVPYCCCTNTPKALAPSAVVNGTSRTSVASARRAPAPVASVKSAQVASTRTTGP
jgi:hypothetical protein